VYRAEKKVFDVLGRGRSRELALDYLTEFAFVSIATWFLFMAPLFFDFPYRIWYLVVAGLGYLSAIAHVAWRSRRIHAREWC
jgi:hypothetical protein